jgi:hypothetical protein
VKYLQLIFKLNHVKEIYIQTTIDLVLIDQQSVGKRSLHLMDTVSAKKRWTTIYIINNFFNRVPQSYPPC